MINICDTWNESLSSYSAEEIEDFTERGKVPLRKYVYKKRMTIVRNGGIWEINYYDN